MKYSNQELKDAFMRVVYSELMHTESGDVSKSMAIKSALRPILFRLSDLHEFPEEFDCDECNSDELQALVDEFDVLYFCTATFGVKEQISSNKSFFRRLKIINTHRHRDVYSVRRNHTHFYAETNYWVN